ncbi:DEAD/DEAH box helicase family protein [Acidimicrobiales bacterium]|nr:DEAD/DEAH box helicase family protein [Acidimicrobiales bacterium]
MSQFGFLEAEFPEQFEAAVRAERYALDDPGTSIIHARRALESTVKWVFRFDRSLTQPYEDKLNAYLNEPSFKAIQGGRVFDMAKKIQRAGNRAVHESKPPKKMEAVEIVSALYLVSFWLAFTYGREAKPEPGTRFVPHDLPRPNQESAKSLKERQALERELAAEAEQNEITRQRAAELEKSNEQLEAELAALRAEIAAAKQAAEVVPLGEVVDLNETATRQYLIDPRLNEAGWLLTDKRDREYPVTGMPTGSGKGLVDYVLWGDDGRPLAVVEAKKATVEASVGQRQAALYADCLEAEFGRRPVIFYTNGYEHWLWDDTEYPPRRVQGFYSKKELELVLQRRGSRQRLADLDINAAIAGRPYQQRAIRSISESFENDKQRKSLLVMATGSGKTRTVIAMTDLLQRANWAKRVLFLADRTALVRQAVNAFKEHLPDSAPVNLVEEPDEEGRIYVSTYQTMMGKIDEKKPDGTFRFGVGYFDLIVIDEAHRSVYKKYRSIFEYFDSFLVGLTATPKDEVSKNTYDLFDLETGVPTDAYSLDEAISDSYLVPPKGVSVPLKFMREGIKYDELSEDEKEEFDEIDWGEDDEGNELDQPDHVKASELNKWLFNKDTVDQVLKHLMTNGIKVAGSERVGKTIIFAKNQRHADFIYERFIANYPTLDAGRFAEVITNKTYDAQGSIEKFSIKEASPHIAISVDMLDTGIDVPEVVNLVLFKQVRSKTKFWQMLGRGTRLCPDLFAPGDDKTCFNVFDYCQNLEYFSEELAGAESADLGSLSERLFSARLELIGEMDRSQTLANERGEIALLLQETIASMNRGNFLVRPHLQLVEKYSQTDAWTDVIADLGALAESIAPLPSQMQSEPEDAKRFDMMVLNAELAMLKHEPVDRYRNRIMAIAELLEDKANIPQVEAQLELLLAVQEEEWWVDVTYPMLEDLRTRLRLLVNLIDRHNRDTITSDFKDEMGEVTIIDLPGTGGAIGSPEFAQFRKKAEHFLKQHLADATVAKVRSGAQLTGQDISDLQRILVAAGVGDTDDFETASERAGSFERFVRSIVGLDRAAAKEAFNDFLDDKRYSRNQIEFVNLIIDELTSNGYVEPKRLYETPYRGLAPSGPEDMFTEHDVNRLFEAITALTPGG